MMLTVLLLILGLMALVLWSQRRMAAAIADVAARLETQAADQQAQREARAAILGTADGRALLRERLAIRRAERQARR